MSEPEKKGSPWPWILVPIGAVGVFFLLRQCRQNLPPAPDLSSPATTTAAPEAPAPADAKPAGPDETPAPAPAPQ